MGKAYNNAVGYRSRKRHYHGRNKQTNILEGKSASAKKLKLDNSTIYLNEKNESKLTGYRLIDVSIFFHELSNILSCKICQSQVNFLEESVRGNSSVFVICCPKCKTTKKINSCPMQGPRNTVPEINLRLIYTMRCIGQGLAGLKTFCNVMNMPPPVAQKSYDCITKKLKRATQAVAEKSMQTAAKEEGEISGNSRICVSGDGTWKTRGHTSKIGVCSIIGADTGKVLDVEVLSSFCKACESKSLPNHDCKKNHAGSAGKMEVIGMKRIFLRSEANRKLQYVKYLGDGDTKTFLELTKSQPYADLAIEKLECIGHVQKRMGTRLRKLKQQARGVKLPDGKTLGGKGRLTDDLISKLTVYYGNAIRSNSHSLTSMREAVWATYCHMCSTDKDPMHMFCPKGADSWCKFEKHIACVKKKPDIFHHKSSVPIEVMKYIKGIYADLSAPSLLKRCLSGKTQNPNESFNSVIWKFCPKTSGSGKTVADVAVNEAVISFNEGSTGRLKTLMELGITPGCYSTTAAKLSDAERIKIAEKRCDFRTLEARRAKRLHETKKNELLVQQEGISYKAGEF